MILNIETATRNCSVALAQEGVPVSVRELATEGYSHAEKLHVFIDEVIREAGINYTDLKAVAVGKGPGSYTGLRIGVSAAKGLCYALGIPLVAVDSLEILARQVKAPQGTVIPLIDARRMEAYSAAFSGGNPIKSTWSEILTPDSFKDFARPLHIAGDCLEKCRTVIFGDDVIYHDNIEFPSAVGLTAISYQKFLQGIFEDVAYFEPFYLKDFKTT
ncbi:MAG TPA: tRNA (adenosine(37)-N6)-threonylcarbamoyltransferase complex dimerization subunit type 1 TsaB [Flavobacterium sp.]|nr:tRNA (adenosine(37)-N6)-threonylcarbamoyltransferase complex dimerization subunit type 1 TsaB [Flavobacterium sp.]